MRANWILPSTTKTLMNSTQNMNQLNTDECMLTGYYQAQQKLSGTLVKIWTSSKLTRVDESAKELTRVDGKTRARVSTFITFYRPSSPFFSENNYQDWFLFNQDILLHFLLEYLCFGAKYLNLVWKIGEKSHERNYNVDGGVEDGLLSGTFFRKIFFAIGAPKKICPGPPSSSRRPCILPQVTY
jgi:hypothetical protein